MKRFLFGSALLLLATNASAIEITDDFLGELSSQEYQTYLVVDDTTLTCTEHSSNTGYIPVTWTRVELEIPNYDRQQVLAHSKVGMYETQGEGDPETLCSEVARFLASITPGQGVLATKTSKVTVSLVPRYGGGCERELIEQITIKLTDRLVLKAANMRVLSGGSTDSQDCLRWHPSL